jgi:hypothetical protein
LSRNPLGFREIVRTEISSAFLICFHIFFPSALAGGGNGPALGLAAVAAAARCEERGKLGRIGPVRLLFVFFFFF